MKAVKGSNRREMGNICWGGANLFFASFAFATSPSRKLVSPPPRHTLFLIYFNLYPITHSTSLSMLLGQGRIACIHSSCVSLTPSFIRCNKVHLVVSQKRLFFLKKCLCLAKEELKGDDKIEGKFLF